ncbi:MAG: hypothetical protein SOV54_00085 [Faecalibacterium prausnitzii]|nr:hypothetical protein [Faecalibacterium prausnitzii]
MSASFADTGTSSSSSTTFSSLPSRSSTTAAVTVWTLPVRPCAVASVRMPRPVRCPLFCASAKELLLPAGSDAPEEPELSAPQPFSASAAARTQPRIICPVLFIFVRSLSAPHGVRL